MTSTLQSSLRWSPIRRYLELLHILVDRNLKGRYRGSFLGVYWSLLNPLIMTGIYTAIFGKAFKAYFDNSMINYMLAAFTGLIVINFFTASTNQALTSVVGSGGLLNKISLPISIFPISMIAANIFQFAMGSLPLLAFVTLYFSHNLINVLVLLVPLIALSLVCMGIGFLVSALYVFFRDLPYFYELVCFALWMSSPVFYPSEIVPENIRAFLILNPLYPIIESIRQISLSGHLPWLLMGQSLLEGLLIAAVGWFCFRTWQNQFMDLL